MLPASPDHFGLFLLLFSTLVANLFETVAPSLISEILTDHPTAVSESTDYLAKVEGGFLGKLGVKSKVSNKYITVPRHLMKLYGKLRQFSDAQQRKNSKRERPLELLFDAARSFFPEESDSTSLFEKDVGDFRHIMTTKLLSFRVEGIKHGERLRQAELRLNFKRIGGAKPVVETAPEETGSTGPPSGVPDRLRVNLFEAVRQHNVLTDTAIVDCSSGESSLALDVSAAVARWRRRTDLNGSLTLQITTPFGSRCEPILDAAPVTSDSPVLIAYTDASENDVARRRRRFKRDAAERPKQRLRHGRRRGRNGRRRHQKLKNNIGQLCQRKEMLVDFKSVGWDDWIVAPRDYQAYYCDGICEFPFPNSLNATNHAIVQSLFHSVEPNKPNPCCVPTDFSPISLLYLNEYDKVELKTYQNMIVEACGCH